MRLRERPVFSQSLTRHCRGEDLSIRQKTSSSSTILNSCLQGVPINAPKSWVSKFLLHYINF